MSADALTRRVRSTSFGLVAWEAAIVLCLAEAVTSTILGRTLIYHATLGWVLVATSIAAVALVWLLSFWSRAYPFLRSQPTTLKPPRGARAARPLLSAGCHESNREFHNNNMIICGRNRDWTY